MTAFLLWPLALAELAPRALVHLIRTLANKEN